MAIDGVWATVIGVGGMLGMGGGVWTLLVARQQTRASPPAAMAEADAKLVDSAAAFVAALTASSRERDAELLAVIARQDARLEEFDAKLRDCEAHRGDCEARVSALEEIIRRGMAEPIPPWLPGLPSPKPEPQA